MPVDLNPDQKSTPDQKPTMDLNPDQKTAQDQKVAPDQQPTQDKKTGEPCVPESVPTAFCGRLGKTCGIVTAKNNCGLTITTSCGKCTTTGVVCSGDVSKPNTCAPCTHPSVYAACAQDTTSKKLGFYLCKVPAGCFTMGTSAKVTDPCKLSNEHPHEVVLTNKMEVMETEVTQGLYMTMMGYNPSYWATYTPSCKTPSCPVEKVSWHEAAAFCNSLSKAFGYSLCYTDTLASPPTPCTASKKCGSGVCFELSKGGKKYCRKYAPASGFQGADIYKCNGFRLPTEAEWEYAYRAGDKTPFYQDLYGTCSGQISKCSGKDANASKIGWYNQNCNGATQPAKGLAANKWGLYDMAGNVKEWNHEPLQSNLGTKPVINPVGTGSANTVVRGGATNDGPDTMRAACRQSQDVTKRMMYTGFRCVRSIP